MKIILIDLERSIGSGRITYWKAGSRGYTLQAADAGHYSEKEASRLISTDIDENTIGITVKHLKGLTMENLKEIIDK